MSAMQVSLPVTGSISATSRKINVYLLFLLTCTFTSHQLHLLAALPAYMFSGYSNSGSTVGCAFVGRLCNTGNSGGYGVNYISYTSNSILQYSLFAHELGHNLDADHYLDSGGKFIMESSINNGQDGFSQQLINSILDHLDDTDCSEVILLVISASCPPCLTRLSLKEGFAL